MPEGPEAAFIAQTLLANGLAGTTLEKVKFHKGRYVKHGPPDGYSDFARALPLRLLDITSHGKVIKFQFEKGWTMISHLGLMGWWYLPKDAPRWRNEYRNASFVFRNNKIVTYSDQLSYGTIKFSASAATESKNDALDFMKTTTNWKALSARIGTKRKLLETRTIEEAIVDQHLLLCGIGNYLKAEILYAARISPLRMANDVEDDEWKNVLRQSKLVAKRMLGALKKDAADDSGYDAYEAAFNVYMRKFDPFGNVVERYKNSMGRQTYWVPAVQH